MKNLEKLIPPTDLKHILEICQTYQEAGHEIYLVGGCVRDLIIGIKAKDFDFATSAPPEFAEEAFSKTNPIGKAFGTIQVVLDRSSYEITTFRQDQDYKDGRHPDTVLEATFIEDAKRRDFRMNAIYWNPLEEEVLDPMAGKKDIDKGEIHFIGDASTRIQEDHLRILRAYRFHAQLGFEIPGDTQEILKQNISLLDKVSWSRKHSELKKALIGKEGLSAINMMQKAGVFKSLLGAREQVDLYGFFTALLYVKDFNLNLEELYGFFLYLVAPQLAIENIALSNESKHAYRYLKDLIEERMSDLDLYKKLSNRTGTFLYRLLQHNHTTRFRYLEELFQGDPHKFEMPEKLLDSSDLMAEGFTGKALGKAIDAVYLWQIQEPEISKEELLLRLKSSPNLNKNE